MSTYTKLSRWGGGDFVRGGYCPDTVTKSNYIFEKQEKK